MKKLFSTRQNEESFFQTAIDPLKLVINKKDVWINSKCSSSHLCRPLHLQYQKETKAVTVNEDNRIREEIMNLLELPINFTYEDGTNLSVSRGYNVNIIMLDGKAVNAITNANSTQTCNVCGAKPSEMNNLFRVREKQINQSSLKLGLSSLHCWMRTFEYILHLSYK